jgi:DNA (cytosine-5)-methyltransferase 1
VLGADDVGAPHRRKRVWILASVRQWQCGCGYCIPEPEWERVGKYGCPNCLGEGADANRGRRGQQYVTAKPVHERQHTRLSAEAGGCDWFRDEPIPECVAHGVAYRVDRLAALGDGQVPAVVRAAWRMLTNAE